MAHSFEFIVKTAEKTANNWSNKERAMFHYWNPNGAMQQYKIVRDQLFDAVAEGRAKSGAFLAYNINIYSEYIIRGATELKFVNNIKLCTSIELVENSKEQLVKFLEEIK